jgi:hypothetical protein
VGVVLSVKSGPADVNKGIVDMFVEYAREAIENDYRPYLVLTYGKRAFTVAESTLRSRSLDPRKYLLVSRDIFKAFLGDSSLYDTVIDLIRGAGGTDRHIRPHGKESEGADRGAEEALRRRRGQAT